MEPNLTTFQENEKRTVEVLDPFPAQRMVKGSGLLRLATFYNSILLEIANALLSFFLMKEH